MNVLSIPRNVISRLTGQEGQPPARCVIGIGREKAEALLVEWDGGSARIVAAGGVPHPVRFGSDPAGRIVPVARACERALSIALGEARRRMDAYELPEEAVVGLPVPLAQGKLCKTTYKRPKPGSPITASEVAELFRRLKRLAQSMVPPRGKLLDIGPVSVSVDGHEATDPRGLQGSRLEVKANVWFLEPEAWRAVRVLAEKLDFDAITFTAIPRIFPLLTGERCWLLEWSHKGGVVYLLDRGLVISWASVAPDDPHRGVEEALCSLASECSSPPSEFKILGGAQELPEIKAWLRELCSRKPELFPRPFNVRSLVPHMFPEMRDVSVALPDPEGICSLALALWIAQKRRGFYPLEEFA